MHGVQIMYKGFHCLIGFSSCGNVCFFISEFIDQLDLFLTKTEGFLQHGIQAVQEAVVHDHSCSFSCFLLHCLERFSHIGIQIDKQLQRFVEITDIFLAEGFCDTLCQIKIKGRYTLTAMLIVLVTLDCDCRKSCIAGDILRFTQMPVTG